jgi:DNA-binding beta-propeller fold protein YncE
VISLLLIYGHKPDSKSRYGHDSDEFVLEDVLVRSAKGVALDETNGHLFVVDSDRNRIVVFDIASGSFVRSIGKYGSRPGQLWIPTDIAIFSEPNKPTGNGNGPGGPQLVVTERLNRRHDT